jgi:type I restriction enzyme S subunit
MFAKEAERWSYGITSDMWSLRPEHFKLIGSLLPPPDEQAAIVRFLDHWNGRLEKAIRAKRRVIALLQEQKQAIIHRAVTRGLDPHVKLKDSGIPWLGEIPEHWESMPNRANLKIRKKLVGERSSEYTLLSLTMRGVIARDMENPTGKFPAEFNTYQEVRPGDLIFCLFDIDETPRGVGISRLNGMITGAYTVFEPRNPEIAEFLYLHYLAMDEEKCLKPLYTGLRKTIPKPRLLGIKTPIPPPDERIAIVRHIKEETVRIDTIIARYEREITLLREYRTRLTADVVTGKLDVRAAAAQLPEEAEEEPLPDPELPEEETELEEVEG